MIERVYNVHYVNQWRRLWALLLDLFLYLIFFVPFTFALLLISFEQRTVGYFALYLVALLTFFQVYLTTRLGGSLGKLTTNIKIVNRQKQYIKIYQAVIRALPFWLVSCYLISFLYDILQVLPDYEYPTTIEEALKIIVLYGQSYFNSIWLAIILGVLIADHIVVIAIPGKQTLHDVFAGTYAITRESYYAQTDRANAYRQGILESVITLQNYRAGSILERLMPQKAVVKNVLLPNDNQLRLFLIEFEKEIVIEGRIKAGHQFIVQLQNEHTTLRAGRNQVVFLLSIVGDLDFKRSLEITEKDMQFIDFVVVE